MGKSSALVIVFAAKMTMAFVRGAAGVEARATGVALAQGRKSESFVQSILSDESTRLLVHWQGRQLVNGGQIAWREVSLLRQLGLRLEEDDGQTRAVVLSWGESPRLAVDLGSEDRSALEGAGLRLVGTRELMGFGTMEAIIDAGRAQALLTWHGEFLSIP